MELCVMVIDDDKIFNLLAQVLLREAGITDHPTICTSGQEALAYLNDQVSANKTFLLFLDINMPLMSGWEVLDELKKKPFRNHIYVVIVTSSVDKADREMVAAYDQLIGYMIKPVKMKDLLALKTSAVLSAFFSAAF